MTHNSYLLYWWGVVSYLEGGGTLFTSIWQWNSKIRWLNRLYIYTEFCNINLPRQSRYWKPLKWLDFLFLCISEGSFWDYNWNCFSLYLISIINRCYFWLLCICWLYIKIFLLFFSFIYILTRRLQTDQTSDKLETCVFIFGRLHCVVVEFTTLLWKLLVSQKCC